MMYIISTQDVSKIAVELSKEYQLYGPVVEKDSGQVFFSPVDEPGAIDLAAALPAMPPKQTVFPQLERILSYRYDRSQKAAEVLKDFAATPRALVGLRSCDLAGLLAMDRFFMGQEFVDEVYLEHRKKMFIVANTCVTPFKQCFCACTDSGPTAAEGYDLNLTLLGDEYLVEAGSEGGKALAEKLGLKTADAAYAAKKRAAVDHSLNSFEDVATVNKAWVSRVMNRITTGFIPGEVWEYVGNQCFECGACSFVCPTCSCFNIEDVNRPDSSTDRLRQWDSCSFEGYTRMAGDHNPRKPIEDRRNKRFFCKLSYSQSKKYLRPGCVGCGRCAWVCPGDIGLPNVVTYVRREISE